jgi:hypothetical protein
VWELWEGVLAASAADEGGAVLVSGVRCGEGQRAVFHGDWPLISAKDRRGYGDGTLEKELAMAELPDPVIVDFVLCDGVARDLSTGRLSLLGLRREIVALEVPVKVTFAAFVRMTNVRESIPVHFRIVDASGELIFESLETELPKPADEMLDVISIMHFPDVELPQYGPYFVQVWRPERYIMEKK